MKTALLFALVLSVITIFTFFTLLQNPTIASSNNSPDIIRSSNSDLSGRKVIVWFAAGAFGYGAIYTACSIIFDEN